MRDKFSEFKSVMATIIQSLLDTDLYKFTMLQVVLHHKFPQNAQAFIISVAVIWQDTEYPLDGHSG